MGRRRSVPCELRPEGSGILRPILGLIFLRFAVQRQKPEQASAADMLVIVAVGPNIILHRHAALRGIVLNVLRREG